MAETIALVDYGAGNLHSVHNALKAVGAQVCVTAKPEQVQTADRIVLPGVGSFKACAHGLNSIPGMVEVMSERVRDDGTPFLGICVGMQLLATRGLEHGATSGLDWVPGDVRLIEQDDLTIKVPHMGWNDVSLAKEHAVLDAGEAYFLHSYHFAAKDPAHIAAVTDHGAEYVAAVALDNILGVQFHPEKSQAFGLSLLSRFLEWKP